MDDVNQSYMVKVLISRYSQLPVKLLSLSCVVVAVTNWLL